MAESKCLIPQAEKLPERAVQKGEARVWHILKKHRHHWVQVVGVKLQGVRRPAFHWQGLLWQTSEVLAAEGHYLEQKGGKDFQMFRMFRTPE